MLILIVGDCETKRLYITISYINLIKENQRICMKDLKPKYRKYIVRKRILVNIFRSEMMRDIPPPLSHLFFDI